MARVIEWQTSRNWTLFPYFIRSRNNIDAAGMWWPEWYAFIGPFQFRIWGKPRQ